MKKLVLLMLLCCSFGVAIQTDNTSVFVGQSTSIKLIGLTANTHYIVVYSQVLENYTFQASGYSYVYKIILPTQEADALTVSVYEYSTTTAQNSSALLTSFVYNVETFEDYNFISSIVDTLPWIAPVIFFGIALGILLRMATKR